jgi:HlyD family secretion protein
MPKPKGDSTFNMLVIAAILALGVGYYVPPTLSGRTASETAKIEGTAKPKSPGKPAWAASAPGRVEPIGGEVRIGTQVPGRIAEVLVSINDMVAAGDLLVRLEDEELIARVHALSADVAFKKRDRDNTDATGKAASRRTAEDGAADAERALAQSRDDLDRLLRKWRAGGVSEVDVDKARDLVNKAKERLEQARTNLRRALSVDGLPAPTRPEAALAAARAELAVAEAALERTRIRSASVGTVLQVNAKPGETVVPSFDNALVVVGNLSSLRVRAEFEERDVGKVRVGQAAVVRSDAFPGKDFDGKVVSLAQALAPSRLGQRGPRKPTDIDVLEVTIELSGQPPLLPGMRVDVFLRSDAAALPAAADARQAGPEAKAN